MLEQSIQVSKVFRWCPLKVQGLVFLNDLTELSFREFDLILGMDWLVEHRVGLDSESKKVRLKVGDSKEVVKVREHRDYLFNVISI